MMEGINLYSIDYYKKTVFKGSYRGLCFRIGREEVVAGGVSDSDDDGMSAGDGAVDAVDEGASDSGATGAVDGGTEEKVPVLRVQAWKGPYILEKTSEEVFTKDFSYSDEGLAEANEWLEQKQKEG